MIFAATAFTRASRAFGLLLSPVSITSRSDHVSLILCQDKGRKSRFSCPVRGDNSLPRIFFLSTSQIAQMSG